MKKVNPPPLASNHMNCTLKEQRSCVLTWKCPSLHKPQDYALCKISLSRLQQATQRRNNAPGNYQD